MCQHSCIFQKNINKLAKEDMCSWFHNFLKSTYNESIHKDCEKRIANLKNMVRAVSGNNLIAINDLEYSRIVKLNQLELLSSNGILLKRVKESKFIIMEKA